MTPCIPSHEKTKRQVKHWRRKTEKQENHVVCTPDSGPAVALSAPRSASLADSQPPGASKSLPGLEIAKKGKQKYKN
jgi:hypothetical protein